MEKENRNSLCDLISPYENPAYIIAEELRGEGYAIAGHLGVKQKFPSPGFVGILKERKPIQKNFYGIKYNKSQRALHLGTIWMNNREKEATENKNWVLEVYGEKYLPRLTKIVEKISAPYNVKIEVKLLSKEPKEEHYLSDLVSKKLL